MAEKIKGSESPETDQGRAIIQFSNVSFAFSSQAPLFRNVNLSVASGSFYWIKGPSGAGKSTLLRLINRLEEPSSGTISFNGKPLRDYHPAVLRRSVLYIQQTPVAVDASVRDNLLLPFTFKNNQDLTPPDDDKLNALLREFRLATVDLRDNALTLSTGQLQRLCFIRGILLLPKVLLLDEPTSALDEESSRIVEAMVTRWSAQWGLTVLMVSHRRFESASIGPVVLEVRGGEVKEFHE